MVQALLAQCSAMNAVVDGPMDLPDPDDHDLAWWNGEPAYLAWWRRLTETNAPAGAFRSAVSGASAAGPLRLRRPSNEAVNTLVEMGPLVEIGAGAGYWARLLRDRGSDILAFDQMPVEHNSWTTDVVAPWTEVDLGGIEMLHEHPDRAVFVCWPPRPNGFMKALLDTARPSTGDQDGLNEQLISELFDRAKAGGLQLTEEGGVLGQLTKRLLESALDGEITDHLGYDKHDPAGRGTGNSRNGTRPTGTRTSRCLSSRSLRSHRAASPQHQPDRHVADSTRTAQHQLAPK